jgi:hypothetical protein
MNTLWLKLILTPSLIYAASMVGRKWGDAISGWMVALPLTTGPITLLLALTHGTTFAASSAAGTLAGGFSLAAFVLVYARLAPRWSWLPTLAAATAAFALITAGLQQVTLPLVPLWAAVLAAFFIVLRALPREDSNLVTESPPGRWDIPLRMTLATGFVLLITGLAPALGPRLTGLLIPFPLFTATFAAFAHHQHGPAAALKVFRGLLMGLFAYASFLFTLALLLEQAGIGTAFAIAIVVVCVMQGISLWMLQRRTA